MHVVPANLSANNGMKIRNAPLAESRASRTKRNETNVQHPRSCPSFSMLVYEFDHSISKKTYISSLGKRFFFLYYIYPISILFKNCFILEIEEEFYPISIFFKNCFILEIEEEFYPISIFFKNCFILEIEEEFYPISIFFKNCFILEIEEEFWSKIANRINFYDWYFKVTRSIEDNEAHPCLLETQLRVYPPETRNQWKSFTRNNHEFIVSLSLSYGHNYIIRCTLSCRHGGPVAHATTPCVHAYPWEPIMRWWSRFPSPCEGGRRGCTRWCCRWAIAL